MTHAINELGQPIGYAINHFTPPPRPNFPLLVGNFVRVEPLLESHLSSLYDAFSLDFKKTNGILVKKG